MSLKRIRKEIIDLQVNKDTLLESGISVIVNDNDLCNWEVLLLGPVFFSIFNIQEKSVYAGGIFKLKVYLKQNNYPFSTPKITFITKIIHPNICPKNGVICNISILDHKWHPRIFVKEVLVQIQGLLSDPEYCDFFDPALYKIYKENKEEYFQKIKQCVYEHAQP